MTTEKVIVLISVDAEHSIGGAFENPFLKPVGNEKRIFGIIGDRVYGIPLIMDIADRHNVKLSFFLEVFNKHYFGSDESRQVCEYILKRGHDVQLHIHPIFLIFSSTNPISDNIYDTMTAYDPRAQQEIIEEGIKTLKQYGVSRLIAFRAGSFSVNEATLDAVRLSGLLIDSSYSRSHRGATCQLNNCAINDAERLSGIVELPITNFIEHSFIRAQRFMPLDINGVGFEEIKSVLKWAYQSHMRFVTIIMHSFSFIKPHDVQYRRMRPRWEVIRRFERLCKYLDQNRTHFETRVFGSLEHKDFNGVTGNSVHAFPKMNPILTLTRGFEQLADKII